MKIYDHRIPSSLTIITLPFLTRNPPFGLGEGPGQFRHKRKSGRGCWGRGPANLDTRENLAVVQLLGKAEPLQLD